MDIICKPAFIEPGETSQYILNNDLSLDKIFLTNYLTSFTNKRFCGIDRMCILDKVMRIKDAVASKGTVNA